MQTKSTCCYCGTGCGVVIEHDGRRIHGVHGDAHHPANAGRLCTKGSTLHLSAGIDGRILHPELRLKREDARRRVSWGEAIGYAADRFAEIIARHGPDAVAFYVSGQLLTEDYYVFNKLARALVGTNNIDSNSRLCMSSAVAAYKATLGADAPPCSYDDVDEADCILIAGSNTAWAHPIVFRRIEDARARNPERKLIVVDPRRTATAASADLHLALKPGTDLLLLNAILHVLIAEGLVDERFIARHTTGFDALQIAVRDATPAAAAEGCGLVVDQILGAARWFGTARSALSLWCQGLNQSIHGTDNGAALIHLHLATGQIGRPGAGPFSLTGQPNAMGGRETGAMATLLPGHRDPRDPGHRSEIARIWRVRDLPATPGKTAVEMFDAIARGEIKALWIACTNPAQSLPHEAAVREALRCAEFVVLQEAFLGTETDAHADLLLPAATWGEKEGSVTNSERRISHVRAAVPAPGEARPDWRIACDFALGLGKALQRSDAALLFPYTHPEEIFLEHARTTRGKDLDMTGLSYALLDGQGPQQWPFPAGATHGRTRLYEDGRFPTPDGRARFVPLASGGVFDARTPRYPLSLLTGRSRDQWHGMSRTGRVARLFQSEGEARLHLHAEDMARRGLKEGDFARVASRRGALVVRVGASDELKPGEAFLPMHWGRAWINGAGANGLMPAALDPQSKQPELKHAAIEVERMDLGWRGLVVRGEDHADEAVAWRTELARLLKHFDYASVALAGYEEASLVLRLAHRSAPSPALLDGIDAMLRLDGANCLVYRDERRGVRKKALIEDGRLVGIHLAGEVAAADWLQDFVAGRRPVHEVRHLLFAPLVRIPEGMQPTGRIVCLCSKVAESDIRAHIATGGNLDTLRRELGCGAGCGSCLPEVRRLAAAAAH